MIGAVPHRLGGTRERKYFLRLFQSINLTNRQMDK
jgi:hypothetical protein